MTSQVEISLTGSNIPKFTPCGATLSYGVNRMPTAVVQLEPNALALLCDFEQIRRQPATLKVSTPTQCLMFDGIIDGHSISQQPGGLSTALILKSKFVFLNEVYPRLLGMNAGSQNIFALNKSLSTLSSNFYTSDPNQITSSQSLLANIQQLYGYSATQLNFGTYVIDFIVQLMKAIVESQTVDGIIPMGPWKEAGSALNAAIQESDVNSKVIAPIIQTLLAGIDTSYCENMSLFANSAIIADHINNNISMLQDTIFQNLIKLSAEYGACVVVGNNSLFIVPEAAYLLIPKASSLRRGVKSNSYNQAFPSEYENFSFSDNGEATIKGVYLVEDCSTSANHLLTSSIVWDGHYLDPSPNIVGNVVVRTLPNYATMANAYSAAAGSVGINKRIKNGTKLVSGKVVFDDYAAAFQQVGTAITNGTVTPGLTLLDNLAEIEYCKMKFDDRAGSINTYFNNNYAPGAVGSLYTRQPGTYIDFFVTSVTHNFSLSAPSNGSATTTINFKGGRMGNSTSTGLDRVTLYDYNYADSQDFCGSFVGDISTP